MTSVPGIGRIVWYHPGIYENIMTFADQPLPAIVTAVMTDIVLNLTVFDAMGEPQPRPGTPFWTGEGPVVGSPPLTAYCEWPPTPTPPTGDTNDLRGSS